MTGGLYQATTDEIRQLLDNPKSIGQFVEASTWAPPVRELRPTGVFGWLMRLSPVKVYEADPDAEPPQGYDRANDRPHCDLEGVWDGLHFLFTGTAWEGDPPSSFLIHGGDAIGDADDFGYSSLHALSPAHVRQFSSYLSALSHDELGRRYDPARMRSLGVDARPLTDLLEAFDTLRTFIDAVVAADAGTVVYVT